MRIKLILSALLLSVIARQAYAQQDSISFFTSARAHAGIVVIHSPELAQLSKRAPISFQWDVSLARYTQRAWDYCNCYSKTGVSFNYIDFGNAKVLGQALSAVFYIEPYLSLNDKSHFSFRAGVGPAYMTTVYDEVTNPENLFYSMHLSYLITVNGSLYIRMSERTRLIATLQFNHISNGGTIIPNYGINFPTTGIGLEYNFNPKPLTIRPGNREFDRSIKYVVHAFGGPRVAKAFPGIPEVRKTFFGVNGGVLKPLGKIGHIGIGAEWYMDPLAPVLEARKSEHYQEQVAALGIQYYVFFGKMFFSPQLFHYLTPRNADIDTNWYQRYWVGYRITPRWFAGVGMKAHLEVADHGAITVGAIF